MKLPRKDYAGVLQQGLVAFEREFYRLGLVLAEDTLSLAAAIDRAISSQGHLLLAGRSGCGRKSTVVLICHLLRLEMVSLPPARSYSAK